jgi:hypothetical protein
MARDRNCVVTVSSLEEFRKQVLKAFFKKLGRDKVRAAETGHSVVGEFGVGQQGAEPLLRVRYICKPGQSVRVLKAVGPLIAYTFGSPDWVPSRRLH